MIMNNFTSECITMYTSQDPSRCTHHLFPPEFIRMCSPQNSSRCTHRTFSPFSAQDEIACRPASPFGIVSCTSWQDQQCWFLRDACEVTTLSPETFSLHPEPLDFKMLQSSTTLAPCDPNASTRVRHDNCFHRHPRILSKWPGCASCALSPS